MICFSGGASASFPCCFLVFSTCDSCVISEFGCRLRARPLPPGGCLFCGTLACVGDLGTVLLIGFTLYELVFPFSAGSADLPQRCGVVIKSSGAGCGDLLPLEPAGHRRLTLEVKVPAAAVLIHDLLQPQLQVPAQLLVIHRAEQTPTRELFAPDGIHPLSLVGVSVGLLLLCALLLRARLRAAGRTMSRDP